MSEEEVVVQYEFLRRVLTVYAAADAHELLWWRVDDGALSLYASCNDPFYLAAADVEPITPENVHVLEQTLADLTALDAEVPRPIPARADMPLTFISDLFAARVRKMRPQQPYLAKRGQPMLELFTACGPERGRADES